MQRFAFLLALAAALLPAAAEPGLALDPTWTERKCALYGDAWRKVRRAPAYAGMGEDFVAANERFIAAGCTGERDACPRSDADFRAADALSLMAVTEGMAGSFLPFACRK